MKKCTKCGLDKEDSEFNKGWSYKGRNHLSSYCKKCAKEYREEYKKKYPWKLTYRWIHTRCNLQNHDTYKKYGGKGIKNFLTHEDLEMLWFRDDANNMIRPSIDRIDSSKDYTIENCRYTELSKNSSREGWTYEMRRDLALKSMKK